MQVLLVAASNAYKNVSCYRVIGELFPVKVLGELFPVKDRVRGSTQDSP